MMFGDEHTDLCKVRWAEGRCKGVTRKYKGVKSVGVKNEVPKETTVLFCVIGFADYFHCRKM